MPVPPRLGASRDRYADLLDRVEAAVITEIVAHAAFVRDTFHPSTEAGLHISTRVPKAQQSRVAPCACLGCRRNKALDPLPLVIAQGITIHRRSPRISVESDLRPSEDPQSLIVTAP